MNRKIPRLLAALSLAIALAAATFSAAVAKPAPLTAGGDNLSPAFVTPGGLGGFHVFATNTGGSNISQLFLSGPAAYGVFGSEATFTPSGGSPISINSACPQRGQLLCTFGALRPGDRVDVTVALILTGSGNASGDFTWSTTGFVSGGNQSHGDAFSTPFNVTLANGDQAGSFVWDSNQSDFSNDTNINNSNKQSTSVSVNVVRGPVDLSDGQGIFTCQGLDGYTCPTSFFGQPSTLDINNGEVFDQPFRVVITMYRPGVNASQVHGVYHAYTLNSVAHEFNIQTICPTTGPITEECFTASKLGSQNLQIIVWLFHNGKINGW
jgi:hypothetical protein